MTRAARIDVDPFIGLPYLSGGTNPRLGVDCLWASRRALEEIFPDLEADELPTTPDEEDAALARARAGETRWIKVGSSAAAATKLGDMVQGRREDTGAYVAVVVDQLGRLVLTATREHGTCLVPLRRLPGIEAVFRRGPRR